MSRWLECRGRCALDWRHERERCGWRALDCRERGGWLERDRFNGRKERLGRRRCCGWAQRYGIAPERVAEAMIDLLLQGDLDDKARDLILRTGADGRPDSLRKAIQLILNCPDYQLA